MRKILGILVLLLALALLTSTGAARPGSASTSNPSIESPALPSAPGGAGDVVTVTGLPGSTGGGSGTKDGDGDDAIEGNRVAVAATRATPQGTARVIERLWVFVLNNLISMGGIVR